MILSTHGIIKPLESFRNLHSWQGDGISKHLTCGSVSSHRFLHGALNTTAFEFSMGLWVKMDDPNPGNIQRFFSTSPGSGNVGFALVYRDDGVFSRQITAQISRGVSGTANTVFNKENFSAYPNDTGWNFLLFTYSQSLASNNGELFINNVSAGSGNKTGLTPSTANSTNAPFIASANASTQFLNGKLFGFSIWNKHLSTAERTELFDLKSGNPESLSFWANRFQYNYFPQGQAGYPTWKDLVGSFDATMINGIAADINTDIPT